MRTSRGLRLAACAFALAAALHAQAATYVYSAVGRQMTIVNADENFGNERVDSKQRTMIMLNGDDIDAGVVDDIRALAQRQTPPVDIVRATAEADREGTPVVADAFVDLTPEDWLARIGRGMPFAEGDRLLVVAPARDDIRFAVGMSTAGMGVAAGVGVYVMPNRDLLAAGRPSPGMLGFFTNFRVLLIDPVARRVLAMQAWSGGVARSGRDAPDGNLWQAVGGQDKFAALREAMRAGLEQTVPSLLAR
jgi:hypothetical protein